MQVLCKSCGKQTAAGQFCERCGARLSESVPIPFDIEPAREMSCPIHVDGMLASHESKMAVEIPEVATCAVPAEPGLPASPRRPAEPAMPARPAMPGTPLEPLPMPRSAIGNEGGGAGQSDVGLEWDKLCVLFEEVAGILRFRVTPRRVVRNLEIWVEQPGGGGRLRGRQIRSVTSAREMAVTVPHPSEAGAGVWLVGIAYDSGNSHKRFEGDFPLVVFKPEEARQAVGELKLTINNNIQNGNASDVHISQQAVDDLVRQGGTNPYQALLNLVKSEARVWDHVELDEVGVESVEIEDAAESVQTIKSVTLPPRPAAAVRTSVDLNIGRSIVHFHSGQELTIGRLPQLPGQPTTGCDIVLLPSDRSFVQDTPLKLAYRILSRRHCTMRFLGDKVRFEDGCRDATGAWKRSMAGIFWNGAQVPDGIELGKETSGLLFFGPDRRALALEVRILGNADSSDGGLCVWLSRKREDGLAEHHVGLWGTFSLGEIDPRFSNVEIFPSEGGFAWRCGSHCGWLVPGQKLPADLGMIKVN